MPAKPLPRLPLLTLIVGSSLLAFGPLLVRLSDVGPSTSAFWRMFLAAPVLLLLAFREGLPKGSMPWVLAAGAGAFFAGDLLTWHAGIVRTTAANATLFGNMTAFMLAGWAIVVQGARPNRTTILALLLALAGTALLFGRSAQLSPRHLTGDLLSIMAGAFYTGYLLLVMRLRERLSTLWVLALATFFCALLLLPAAIVEAVVTPQPFWPDDWRPVVALAISSQLAGQGLLVFASGKLPAVVVGLGLLVQPIVSGIAGWLVFGEMLGPVELVGAAAVAAALVIIRR